MATVSAEAGRSLLSRCSGSATDADRGVWEQCSLHVSEGFSPGRQGKPAAAGSLECGGPSRRCGIARPQPRAGVGARTGAGTGDGWRDESRAVIPFRDGWCEGSRAVAGARGESRRADKESRLKPAGEAVPAGCWMGFARLEGRGVPSVGFSYSARRLSPRAHAGRRGPNAAL